jgi:hypothetical protein
MKHDPITGPMPREKLAELIAAPHGEAQDIIRQYDPFWGLAPGAKIDFEVELCAEVTGYAVVQAASLEEAKKLAEGLSADEVEFDRHDLGRWTVDHVQAVKPPLRKKELSPPRALLSP